MRSWLVVDTPGRAHTWLLTFAVARAILDYFWVPAYGDPAAWIASWLNTAIYIYALYLLIPAIAGYILEKTFSIRLDSSAVLQDSVLLWIVYPVVALASLVLQSSPTRTVTWFRYIPAFRVDDNFLPAGMLLVVPVLLLVYARLIVRHSSAGWPRSLTSVLVSLIAVYLAYYQYGVLPFPYLWYTYGPFLAFGYANLTYLLPLTLVRHRFAAAFGGRLSTVPRLIMASAIVSCAMIALSVAASARRVNESRPVLTPLQALQGTTIGWNLRVFQLYDETGALSEYGFYVHKIGSGGPFRQMALFRKAFNSFMLFWGVDKVTSDADQLTQEGMFDIQIEDRPLVFEWNHADAEGNRFLTSFEGTSAIAKCTATVADRPRSCFLFDETASADFSRREPWAAETFLAVNSPSVGLIAFAYDTYTDGLATVLGETRRVTKVSRANWDIDVDIEGGTVHASCAPLAKYEHYESINGLDVKLANHVVRCNLTIALARRSPFTTTVDGMLEWVGNTQGAGQ